MINRVSSRVITRPFRQRGRSRLCLRAAACGIASLFIVTGVIQYRWNLQIRRATEIGIGASLESVMLKWHLNLYRELSTVCIALQVGPDSGAHNRWNDYLLRYAAWKHASKDKGTLENLYSNPDIVSNIYIYDSSAPSARLSRLDPDASRIELVETPTEFRDLLTHLQDKSTNLLLALRAWDPNSSWRAAKAENDLSDLQNKTITGWQFEESIPAIVHPIVHHVDGRRGRSAPIDWLIVILNREAIIHRMFPELTARYFNGNHGLEYNLAVVAAGSPSQLLYSSDPGFGLAEIGGSDSVMSIFGPPPESTEGSFWQVIKSRENLNGEEWRNFSGPVWFPVFRETRNRHEWMLFIKHRTGSVQGAITRVWLGNLLLGSIILVLLAASTILVFVAAQRARTLAAMKMDFVASVSHELRTPLAAILASGKNLSDGFASDQSYYGALITTQARQLIDLVDQILLFASIKDGKKKYSLTAVRLNDVFDNLWKTTLAILKTSGFQLDCRMDENLPPVLGNQQALARCLQNLLENAAKYSGDSRWIGVSADRDEFDGDQAGIRIVIEDRGVGIDRSDLPHIFEPFYRSPSAIAAQIHGNGLGLAVVEHIVKEMGGQLSVNSEVGKGTAFTMHLKVA